nr:hypothetical protein [Tanacetum cinerariifolium]
MSAKRTSWNEFSSSMASAVICLSIDVQGRQAESQAQIYQIDLEHADKVLSMHGDEIEPAELQEVVTTAKLMTKIGTATSATITAATTPITAAPTPFTTTIITAALNTPLFEGMIVAQQYDDVADEGAASVAVDNVPAAADEPSIPSPTPTTQPPPPSQELPSTSQVQTTTPPLPISQPP